MAANTLIPVERIEQAIYQIRSQRVILNRDLAVLYGITPKRLNEQVKRNSHRFPDDFMFQLTVDEAKEVFASRSQSATLKRGQNIKYAPYAFTEHGTLIAANVLNSPVTVEASVAVIRAFIRAEERTLRSSARQICNRPRCCPQYGLGNLYFCPLLTTK